MQGKPVSAVVSAVLLAALGGWLTAPAAADDEEIWKTIFRGATEVNVVNVDVVVTDAAGRPVKSLTRADFELFEDGEPVAISNFFAVEDGRTVSPGARDATGAAVATPAPGEAAFDAAARPLHLILYVDNVNIAPANRSRVFARVREFLLTHRGLDARVMLVSNDRGLVVRQGFTSVPHEIFVALDELAKTTASSPRFELERRHLVQAIEGVNVEEGSGVFGTKNGADIDLLPASEANTDQEQLTSRAATEAWAVITQVQAYSAQRLQHTRETLRVLHQMVDTAAGLPGRKALLYVSDGLSLRPGDALNQACARRFEALPPIAARFNPEAETARYDATSDLRAVIDHANAGQITFYTLDASLAESLSHGSAATSGTAGGNFGSWNDSLASTEEHNDQATLRQMAEGTGGSFGLTQTTYDAVLEGLLTDLGTYYSLGFVAEHDADREQHKLAVKVADKKLRVRYRTSFRDKSVATRTIERTRAALLVGAPDNPLEIALLTDEPEPQGDGTFIVPLRVTIPLSKIVLLPGKAEHQGQVSMFVAVRDEKGRTSEVNHHLCPIRIPNSEVLTALGQSAACGLRLQMRRGPQRIAVSILDELTSIDSTVHLAVDVGAAAQRAELETSR